MNSDKIEKLQQALVMTAPEVRHSTESPVEDPLVLKHGNRRVLETTLYRRAECLCVYRCVRVEACVCVCVSR